MNYDVKVLLDKIPIQYVEHMFVCYNKGQYDFDLLRRYDQEEAFRTKVQQEYDIMQNWRSTFNRLVLVKQGDATDSSSGNGSGGSLLCHYNVSNSGS